MHQQALIGLIGGMSWESSAEYYRLINRAVRNRLGGVHSACILMLSVDFGAIERLQHDGDWDALTEQMKDAAIRLELGGADFILLCTNYDTPDGGRGRGSNQNPLAPHRRSDRSEDQGGRVQKSRPTRHGFYDGAGFL